MAVAVVIAFLLATAFMVHRVAGAAPNRLARSLYALAAVLGTISATVYALAAMR
jgi:hypothetical protein